MGIDRSAIELSTYEVLIDSVAVDDVLEPTSVRDLLIVPATIELAGAEIELVSMFSRENRLANALKPVIGDFDFVLIDCPPSLGLLTVNGLAAAREVMIPIQCEYYALEGVSQLIRNIQLVKQNLNPELGDRGRGAHHVRRPDHPVVRRGQAGAGTLRGEDVPNGDSSHGAALRGPVVRRADRSV